MKTNRISSKVLLIVFALLMIGLTACTVQPATPSEEAMQEPTSAQSASPETTEPAKKLIIGFASNAMDEACIQMIDTITETVEAAGAEIVVTDAQSDVQKQLSDIESLITRECDVIILRAVDTEGLVPGVEACTKAGIPVIDVMGVNSDEVALTLSIDQSIGGAIEAAYIESLLENDPNLNLNIGYIWGFRGVEQVQQRYDGVFNNLQKWIDNGRVKILDEQDAMFDTNQAMAIMENWLQKYQDMNCVLTAGDNMAVGAINVLKAAGADFSKWYVIGFDCRELAYEIDKGTAIADVYMNTPLISTTLGEYALKLAAGETFESKSMDFGDDLWILITKDNVKDVFGDALGE